MYNLAATPVVSVCIANYNGRGLIEACIDSVLGQFCDLSVEIIVHDDCSSDGSADRIAAFYPQVRMIRSQENVGFCISNNRMAAMARGEYLLLLNNDAALFPDALATLYEKAQVSARPAILSLPQYDAQTGELIDIGCLLDPFLNPVPNVDSARQDVGMVIGACLWIPKALWQELGGFPEWFESIGEDLYLCCRARLAGYAVWSLGTSGYRHRVGRSFGGGKVTAESRLVTTFRRRALSERNKTYVLAMTCPSPAVQLLLPLHLALLLIEGLTLSLLNRSHAYLAEIYLPVFRALLRQRGTLLEERRMIMGRRRLGIFEFFVVFVAMPHKLRMLVRHGVPQLK
jgi:GT2 family glycosyltransferase